MTNGDKATPANKVERIIQKYDLEGLGDEIERKWLSEERDGASTRELADLFNRRVLEVALENSDTFRFEYEVDQLYQTLTEGDDADDTLLRSRMEQSDINVDEIVRDFVSHQTVYRYLRDYRGVEQPAVSDEERKEKAMSTIQQLRGRTTAVTEKTIENLRSNDQVSIGEFSVLNDIQIICEECGRSYDATDLIERGACACEQRQS